MSTNRTRYCANCLTTFLGNPEVCGNAECQKARPGTHWGRLLEPGERVDGRFRVDRRLRVTAAGPTYLCQETDEAENAVGALVVLQVISPEAVANEEYYQQLQDEVNQLHALEHPNVVRVEEIKPPESGPPYLVSGYESGGTLMDQLREQGAMSLAHVAQLGLQICDGLRAAHRADIVHGDLHPDRVLLDHIPESGEPPMIRVTDFGALKTQGSMTQGFNPNGFSPQYAAPERIAGGAASFEADVYAIGSLLLFAVSLQPLISNAERMPLDQLFKELESNLPPRWKPAPSLEVDGSQVAFFNAVLNATMAPNPADRCNMDEIRQYLEALLEVEDESVFETPEFTDAPEEEAEEDLSAEDAIQHFNAFSKDPEDEEEEEEEEKETNKTKPAAPKDNKAGPKEANKDPEDGEEEESEEATPRTPRDWEKIIWRSGWALCAMVLVLMALYAFYRSQFPHLLPPSWLEADGPKAHWVKSGQPGESPDHQALEESLQKKKYEFKKCGVKSKKLDISVVVEPNGKVRSGWSSWQPYDQRICIRKTLLSMNLKRRSGVSPIVLRTTLEL